MAAEIAKTYHPASLESAVHRVWMEENCFAADASAPGEPYCIVIPPPNVTGALHLGHAINNVLQDILIRQHRMRGFNTVWIPGIDHAGIATQAVVEKQLKEKENKTRHDVGREELVRRIWQWKEEFGNRILEQLKRLGCSCDWSRTRFTLDEMCARAVRETFFKLFKDGLIYRGKRLVNWDVHLQTSISDDEIYHETIKTMLWHVRYPIVPEGERGRGGEGETGGAKYVVVATTRPETMLGDTAVAVNSQDPRWNWAIGKSVELPLTGQKIPIIADDILVDPKFGTGVVKVTPAHDPNDYAVWQRHQSGAPHVHAGLPIDILNILNPDGTINSNGGKYAGMKREVARKKIVEDLTHAGLLEKEEPYETQIGHSDRSKTPIEPYLSDQWFVKMAPLAEPALQVVRDGIVKFFPERHAQQYLSWLGEKRDWPISRQLWWGHRIPVWKSSLKMKPRPGTATRDSSVVRDSAENPEGFPFNECAMQSVFDNQKGEWISYCCPPPNRPDLESALNSAGYAQDPDVLDTWFSSALWPHSTLGWPEDTAELRKWYPTSVLLTARDIVTLWVARMVMMGMYNMGFAPPPSPGTPGEGGGEGGVNDEIRMTNDESNSDIRHSSIDSSFVIRHSNFPTAPHPNPLPDYRGRGKELGIPFHHVAINPTILDGKGERMSKSKGNGVDPVDVIDTHGADALRFTLTLMATETQDVRMPVKKDAQGRNTSEKFDIGSRFCNKIWQVAQFFVIPNLEKIGPEPVDETKWSPADRWIVSRFNRAIKEVDEALEAYRFDQYAKVCYDFFYGDFCDWYVEAAKPALKDAKSTGQTANILAAVLDGSLRLMHPMIPFITETIWWRLCEVRPERGLPGRIMGCTSNRLVLAAWPKDGPFSDGDESEFAKIQQIITTIRGLRNDHKVEPKKTVDLSIVASAEASRQILANRLMIESLAICRVKEVSPTLSPIADAARTVAAGCDLFVQGLVDREAEKQRNAKRRDELHRLIQTLKGRLANESYIAKAPPHLVQQTKDQLGEAEAELAKL